MDSLPAELLGKSRGTLTPRAALAPDAFKLLTLFTPCLRAEHRHPLLPASSCSLWGAVRMAGHLQGKRVTGCEQKSGGLSADRRLEGGERKPEPELTCYLGPTWPVPWSRSGVPWGSLLNFLMLPRDLRYFIPWSREGNGTLSSTLAWKIPWTEEPGGLKSMGSRRVRHD